MKEYSRFDMLKASHKGIVPSLPFEECLGKTFENGATLSVEWHSKHVQAVAGALLDQMPLRLKGILGKSAVTAAALHDVGKISPGFQHKVNNAALVGQPEMLARMEGQHAYISGAALNTICGVRGEPAGIAEIAALHHGSAPRHLPLDDAAFCMGGKPWAQERKRFIESFSSCPEQLQCAKLDGIIRNLIAGFVTVCDWLGSDETIFNTDTPDDSEGLKRIAENAIQDTGLRFPEIRQGLQFNDVFPGKRPFRFQEQFMENIEGPGLYVLEAPTGTGKTEAALFAAYGLMARGLARGLYFALPTRLTSDKIHERIQPFVGRICVDSRDAQLVHSSAWLRAFSKTEGGEELKPGRSWFDGRKRALLNPFGVGTIDQSLLSVLRVKHFFVRSFALAGKVVILDEVHTYDMYTSNLIEEMITQLLRLDCTVIVLSATLTRGRRRKLFAESCEPEDERGYPVLTLQPSTADNARCVSLEQPVRQLKYDVKVEAKDNDTVGLEAIEKAREGCCVLCIANTVAKAQEWYRTIVANLTDSEIVTGLLHSKFTGEHRAQLEKEWMDRLGPDAKEGVRKPCILVATQVVEQSVDIDADCLITEIAPTDMLLQRMGRVWRHKRFDPARRYSVPSVTVVLNSSLDTFETEEEIIQALGKTNCLVYAPYVLFRTWKVWRHRTSVCPVLEMPELLEETYGECAEPEPQAALSLLEDQEAMQEKLRKLAEAAKANVSALPVGDDKEGFATRYSDIPTCEALLVRSIDATGHKAEIELLNGKKLQLDSTKRNVFNTSCLHCQTISVASYWFTRKPELLRYLRMHFYNPIHVLICDVDGCLQYADSGQDTGLMYTERLGMWRDKVMRKVDWKEAGFEDEYEGFHVFDKKRYDW